MPSKDMMNVMELKQLTRKIIKLNLVTKLFSRQSLISEGIYFGQMPILDFINENANCTQIEIAEHLNVSAASIALSTKRLEKSGFIIKKTDENNLRCKRLNLTAKGMESRKICRDILYKQDLRTFNGFSQDELIVFSNFLDRATINLTNEKENVVTKYTFRDLERQIEKLQFSKSEEEIK